MVALREIPGHGGYFASEQGEIFCTRPIGGSRRPGRKLTPVEPRRVTQVARVVKGNYRRIQVNIDRRTFTSARLIALTFHGAPPTPLHEVAHLNGDPTDNRVENLQWKTRPDNHMDKVEHGTSNRGQRQWMHKITESDVQSIREAHAAGTAQGVLAQQYGVCQSHISGICSRKKWSWLA